MAIPPSIRNPHSSVSSKTIDIVQKYAGIMDNLLRSHFPQLGTAPDALYIMMSTMGWESSFKIFHGNSPNHLTIKRTSGIGHSYWNDPVIVPIRSNPGVSNNVVEGLSAKALMATMGMYQVRGCRESDAIIKGKYRELAESTGLMVYPGESISAKFPNNDTGATRSMMMGCIIMEHKYINRKKYYSQDAAIYLAVGDYLGKAGVRDLLGTTPEMRIQNINDPKTGVAKALAAASISRGNINRIYTVPTIGDLPTGIETKTEVVASSNNVNTKSCSKA